MRETEPAVVQNRASLMLLGLATIAVGALILFLLFAWKQSAGATHVTEQFIQHVSHSRMRAATRLLADPKAIELLPSGEIRFTAEDGTTATLPKVVPLYSLSTPGRKSPSAEDRFNGKRDFAVLTDPKSGFIFELRCSTRDGKIVIRKVRDMKSGQPGDESL